jgi:hypothetical protein
MAMFGQINKNKVFFSCLQFFLRCIGQGGFYSNLFTAKGSFKFDNRLNILN